MFRLSRPLPPPLDNATGNSLSSSCRQKVSLERSERQLSLHHPGVVLPPRLDEQSIPDQIRRCCDRVQSYPKAVDTLYKVISAILQRPNELRFRRVVTSSVGYQRSLANIPGAEQLLRALGFVAIDSEQALVLPSLHPASFELALEMLDQARDTIEYQRAKRNQTFAQQVRELLEAEPKDEEQSKRQEFLTQVPREPGPGRAAVMIVQLLPNVDGANGKVVTRRFDADDTLQDFLRWLGGTTGTELYRRLVHSQEYCLVDVNRGLPALDCGGVDAKKTLHSLGFWPSGRLSLQLTSK